MGEHLREPMPGRTPARPVHGLILLTVLALYIALRLPWVGHLLTWDEAMNLCSVRSFAAGGHDYYSSWIWHHPPLMSLSLLLVRPLEAGFAERAHLLLAAIGSLNLLALVLLCRQTLGLRAGLWAGFFYAVSPAAIHFDLWVKQDPLAILFGLLAMHLFFKRRLLVAGVLMGLALLAKEMAAFFLIGLFVLWLAADRRRRGLVDLAWVCAVAALVSAWWYLGFSSSIRYFVAFALNSPAMETDVWMWTRPWQFFLAKLPLDLGWAGVAVLLAGCAVLARAAVRGSPRALWPLAVLAPAFLLISVAKGKAIWFTIVLYPVIAAAQGAGMAAIAAWADARAGRVGRWAGIAMAVAAAAWFVPAVWSRDYDRYLLAQDAGIWWGAVSSREAAAVLNRVARDGDRVLITPMFYWEYRDQHPCPIFVYYMKDLPVVVRPHSLTPDEFVAAVREYDLDWAVVSPQAGAGEKALIEPLVRDYGLRPQMLKGAFLIPTKPLLVAH